MGATMTALSSVATFVFAASLKSTVLVALVLLAQKLCARVLAPNGRYLLWLPVVIGLVTPLGFALHVPQPAAFAVSSVSPVASIPTSGGSDIAVAVQDAALPGALREPVAPPATPRLPYALPLLWLAGVVAVLGMMMRSTRRFSAMARNGQEAPASLQMLVQDCLRHCRCTTPVQLVQSRELRAPAVAGLFAPVLLWPAGLETRLTPAQSRHVIMHELMHVKRRDSLAAACVALVQALHWFNPVIWIAFSYLRHDREMACDASTVRRLAPDAADAYAHTLIELGALRPRAATSVGLGILGSHAQLLRRIHMLARFPGTRPARPYVAGLLLLPLVALAFSRPMAVPERESVAISPDAIAKQTRPPASIRAEAPTPIGVEDVAVVADVPAPQAMPPAIEPQAQAVEVVEEAPRARSAAPVVATSGNAAGTQEPGSASGAPEPAPVPLATSATALPRSAAGTELPKAPQPGAALAADLTPAADAIVCRRFLETGTATYWRACDTAAAWAEFAQQVGLAPSNLPEPTAATGSKAFALDAELCRYQNRPGSFMRLRSCGSAAGWASIDLLRMGGCVNAQAQGSLARLCTEAHHNNLVAAWQSVATPLTRIADPL